MRTILFILQKEFIQISRNKMMLPMIFVVPLIQLLLLVNVATMEMKHIKIFIVDNDLSTTSRQLTAKFSNSNFFVLKGYSNQIAEATASIENNKADMVLHIPKGFEKKLGKENKSELQLLYNAINGTVAGISNAYTTQIISGYNYEILPRGSGSSALQYSAGNIQIIPSFWYNPTLNYKIFMVPAILVLLVTIIGLGLSSLNIIKEKEMGNIEQINVTPIKKIHFIFGKLLPFWIIALLMMGVGLIIGIILFHTPILGSIGLLFAVASVYLLVILGFGLIISNISSTMQQAVFVVFFFMIIFIMMSGIFTPTDSMPNWAKIINYINPIAYFMKMIRMILLKGSGFKDIYQDFFMLLGYGIVVVTLAVNRYKKVG